MDIFDLDRALIGRYEAFARSFSEIHAPEIRAQVDAAYAEQRFWPDPQITCAYRKSNPAILMMQSPRIGRPRMRPAVSTARDIGASLFNDK